MMKRSFEVSESEYPFRSNWFDRGDHNMHYVDEGAGVPVVMCHGNPTWSFLYRNIIKEMSSECRCIAYDLPGFGFSNPPHDYGYSPEEHAEAVRALLFDHLKLEQFILVGQDWGGPIGLHVATKHPDHVIGVVLSSTFAWKTNRLFQTVSGILGSGFGRYMILNQNAFPRMMVPAVTKSKTRKNKAVMEAYTAPFPNKESRRGIYEFTQQLRKAEDWLSALEQRLHLLRRKPVELIFGLKDLSSRPKDIDRWIGHFPDANVQRLSDANHYTQEDCPEAYISALRKMTSSL